MVARVEAEETDSFGYQAGDIVVPAASGVKKEEENEFNFGSWSVKQEAVKKEEPKEEAFDDWENFEARQASPPATPQSSPKRKRRAANNDDEEYAPGNEASETPRRSSPSKKDLPPFNADESTWRPTWIRGKSMMTRTNAERQYHLTPEDMATISYHTTDWNAAGYQYYLYKERDVEQLAWRKHGGPERFEAMLDRLEAIYHNKSPGKAYTARPKYREEPPPKKKRTYKPKVHRIPL